MTTRLGADVPKLPVQGRRERQEAGGRGRGRRQEAGGRFCTQRKKQEAEAGCRCRTQREEAGGRGRQKVEVQGEGSRQSNFDIFQLDDSGRMGEVGQEF